MWLILILMTPTAFGNKDFRIGDVKTIRETIDKLSNIASMPNLMQTESCRKECMEYTGAFERYEIWALKLYDGNSKLSSGVLSGNTNQLGSFDECISITHSIRGKYCMPKFYIRTRNQTRVMANISTFFQPKNYFIKDWNEPKSKYMVITNPIYWAICIPSSCNADELSSAISRILDTVNNTEYDLLVNIEFDESDCFKKKQDDTSVVLIRYALGLLLILNCVATLLDYCSSNQSYLSSRFVQLFSMIKNGKTAFQIDDKHQANKNGGFLDGVKVILHLYLYYCHYAVSLTFHSFTNSNEFWESWLTSANFYIIWYLLDGITILNGIFVSSQLVDQLHQRNWVHLVRLCIRRYFKFFPMSFGCMFGLKLIDSYMNKSPNTLKLNKLFNSKRIPQHLLLTSNFYELEQMFVNMSYTVAIDMQLYVIAGFIILLAKQSEIRKLYAVSSMVYVVGLICRAIRIINYDLVYVLNVNGTKTKEISRMYYELIYNPTLRLPIYAVGVGLGIYLKRSASNSLSKKRQILGWIAALCSLYGSKIVCDHQLHSNYPRNSHETAAVSIANAVMYHAAVCWLIWYCYNHQSSFLTKMLSWKKFAVFNKMAFVFCYVHFVIVLGNAIIYRSAEHYTPFVHNGLYELLLSLVFTVAVKILYELPFTNILNLFSPQNGFAVKKSN